MSDFVLWDGPIGMELCSEHAIYNLGNDPIEFRLCATSPGESGDFRLLEDGFFRELEDNGLRLLQ